MIFISLLGMDMYQAIDLSRKLHAPLVSAFGCSDDELNFFAPSSFFIHDGVEQTSFWIEVRVHASHEYRDCQQSVAEVLKKNLSDVSVHQHIVFSYFDDEDEITFADSDYPLYMTDSNLVRADTHDEEIEEDDENTGEEPYYGDIISQFDEYIKEHPNASNKEVYDVLTGIREEVTKSKNKKESDE